MLMRAPVTPTAKPSSLNRRLLPLYVAAVLQGGMLWVPVEKLFMTEIGFDAAGVGVMAAAYAAFVPLVELSSGILADRWSRRGVLVLSSLALTGTALVGGMAHDEPTYIASALVLGVYFAMYSGTMDSVVYDTVLDETSSSAQFERYNGRIRLCNSIALVLSALAGGWLAELTSARFTYFATVPFAAASVFALLAFREPQLHKTAERTSLRSHVAVTYRTLLRTRGLLLVAGLLVLTSVVMTTVFEFGPMWLIALAAAPVVFGPFVAGLTATLGLGGLLAGRLVMDHRAVLASVVGLMALAGVVLTMSGSIVVVAVAQVVLVTLAVALSIHLTRLLHDAVPSTVRSGVASGVGALSWVVFLPFALVFGVLSRDAGVHDAAWMIVAAVAVTGLLLARLARDPAAVAVPA